jgi:hypothetical protein
MNLKDLNTTTKNITSLTERYAVLQEIFSGFHSHLESQLEAEQYKDWNIELSDLTELNDFVILIAGQEIIFNFDIEAVDTGPYLGLVTAFITDDYFDDLPHIIASFTFDGSGIAKDLTGLEDPVNLKVAEHCLNIALQICLGAFNEIDE